LGVPLHLRIVLRSEKELTLRLSAGSNYSREMKNARRGTAHHQWAVPLPLCELRVFSRAGTGACPYGLLARERIDSAPFSASLTGIFPSHILRRTTEYQADFQGRVKFPIGGKASRPSPRAARQTTVRSRGRRLQSGWKKVLATLVAALRCARLVRGHAGVFMRGCGGRPGGSPLRDESLVAAEQPGVLLLMALSFTKIENQKITS
jgi:hypothetical protein